MDRKTIAAVALCVLFLIFYRPLLHLIGWDKSLPAQQPVATAPRDTSHTVPGTAPPPSGTPPSSTLSGAASTSATAPSPAARRGASSPGSLFATPAARPPAELEQTFELETP